MVLVDLSHGENGDFTMRNWDLERTSGLWRLDREAWQQKISEFEVNCFRIADRFQKVHNAVLSKQQKWDCR